MTALEVADILHVDRIAGFPQQRRMRHHGGPRLLPLQ